MNQPRPKQQPPYSLDDFRQLSVFDQVGAEEFGGFDFPLETTQDDVREYVRFLNL